MTVQLGMGGKIYTIQTEAHRNKGERFSSVIAVIHRQGTCHDFNALFCCMIALDLQNQYATTQLNITNDHTTPGFNGVWLQRRFRSFKAAKEFVAATQERIDDYLRDVAGASRMTVEELLSREAAWPAA